ncbi:short-chain dehydrogenase/reductase family protein, putative [Trichophyton benhamiae CBS 112371]|uniref:Short-chain dehydrogenase/reductase family protein, putative n=1 Tax=Arthroderma benhamiae (strain ATCC MYA-4681 / CBS 112371) TaxID=663331 RepID=D4AXW5_ARTBC|nr:short-chain dehydrogenase/reductase family protein, putative [Trichophyton benhamiae CBS 112371]EFE32143.1 short-chain dehydrogenase/reductase family protein, putative [Trichophyton benhamiae CBS 112371]
MTSFDAAVIQKRATSLAFYQRQLFTMPPLASSDEVDLAGKTAIITGSNTGLGFECAQQLLDLGLNKLILAVRNETKGEEARGKLLSGRNADNHSIEVWKLDLLCYSSIVSFVERTKSLERLDFFVNNAAFTRPSFAINEKTGHEEIIQVNYFSLALLTILILPVLRDKNSAQQPARLVNVSSDTASWARFRERVSVPLLSAFDREENFHPQDRYATSKLLAQLFLAQLAKRLPPSIAIINTPNPGLCQTSLTRNFKGSLQGILFGIFRLVFARTAAIGARSITDAVVNHGLESHGQYLEDGAVQPMAPFVYTDKGKEVAELLWEETMTEFSFANVSEVLENLSN